MGSRAFLIVCRSKDVARERFGILEDEEGVCYTRTGRRLFEDLVLERELLATVQGALEGAGSGINFKHMTTMNPDTGKHVSRLNKTSEWMSREVPELRIVPDDLGPPRSRVRDRRGTQ